MGKNYLPIFFCIIFLFSCGKDAANEVNLFDGNRYILKSGEKEITKDQASVALSKELKTLFKKEQLILFKHINHKAYDTYLFIDLDSTINKGNIYKTKYVGGNSAIFYQHMVDPKSEITGITLLKNKSFTNRFSQDSLSQERFIILEKEYETE